MSPKMVRMRSPWIAAAASCAWLAGCPASNVCTAGASVACDCGGGEIGTETCASDGSGFGACFDCKVEKATSSGATGGSSSRTSPSAGSTGGNTSSGGSTSGSGGSSSGGSSSGVPGPPEVIGTVGAIAAGSSHSCALVSGSVWCWGQNDHGQLGNGTLSDSAVPVEVSSLGSGGVQGVAAGDEHTCAVVNGGVWCWGDDTFGQLGNGISPGNAPPGAVQGLGAGSGVQAVAAGQYHTCALVNGGAWCWGYNLHGQLGNGTAADSHAPVAVQGLSSGVQAIAAGIDHTCALVSGGVQCWGSNSNGQLGNGTTADSLTPVAVQGLGAGVQGVAAGDTHSCALVNSSAWCWGGDASGQLGDNSAVDSSVPVPVQGLSDPGSGVQAVTAGYDSTCALVNGGLQCWGANSTGQLGIAAPDAGVPAAAAGLSAGVQAVVMGYDHTCALSGGAVECWGANLHGQLGNNSFVDSDAAVAVQGLGSGVQTLVAGGNRNCAVVNGGVQCWGDGTFGALGNATQVDSPVPIEIQRLGAAGSGVQALAAGNRHVCALVNGGVQCWGYDVDGQLGNNSLTQSSAPVAVLGLDSGVAAVTAGYDHTCALIGGGVQCWGYNYLGQLGTGSMSNSLVPAAVVGLGAPDSGVQAVAAGGYFTCALVSGGVQCWGDDVYGELGNGVSGGDAGSLVPVAVQGLGNPGSGVQALAAGKYHACAVVNGGAQCWGDNANGDLGNNSIVPSSVPVAVQGLGPGSGVQAIAAGDLQNCALVNGGLQCWGYNVNGALGNNSLVEAHVPVAVQGLGSGVR